MMRLILNIVLILSLSVGSTKAYGQITDNMQHHIDSLNGVINSDVHDTTKIKAYSGLGGIYYVFDMDTAAGFIMIGNKLAIDELSRGPSENEKIALLRYLANSLNNLGWYYMNKGKMEMAVAHQFKALEINETLDYKSGTAYCYQNIGEIYQVQGDYDKALLNLRKSIAIHRELNFDRGLAGGFDLIAEIKMQMGEYDSALHYLNKSLEHSLMDTEPYTLGEIYANLGTIHLEIGDTAQAILYNFKAYDLNKEIGSRSGLSDALRNLARIDLARNNLESARSYAEESLEAAKGLGFPERIKKSSHLVAKIYRRTGDYEEALENYRLFGTMRDSMRNSATERLALEEEQNYQYKKEREIRDKKHEADLAIQNEQNVKWQVITIITLIVLIGGIVFAWYIYNRYRTIRRQKKLIEEQHGEILKGMEFSKGIQSALQEREDVFVRHFNGHFVLNEPREVVSGDFYWIKEVDDVVVIACADCTGHGVPGGFMSTVGSLLLEKVVDSSQLDPGKLLHRLSKEVIRVFNQEEGGAIQDGMDLSLCVFNKQSRLLKMAGARNGVTVIRNGEGQRYKADLFPVGGNYKKKGRPIDRKFDTTEIELQSNDWLCMYTDGYGEQSGGEEGYPMTYAQFEGQLVNAVKADNPNQMKVGLMDDFQNWKGKYERQDDVLILGMKII